MKPLVVFRVGDIGQVAAVYLRDDSPHTVAAFTVHQAHVPDGPVLGLPVVAFETLAATHPPSTHAMFVAIGYRKLNKAREDIVAECRRRGYALVTYVSSRAAVSKETRIGDNCFVFEQNVIQPFAAIGDNVVMWSGNHVGHHSRIGDHCFVSSHAVIAGRVDVGHHSFIGINATLRDGIRVAPYCVIGAGALVTRDTREGEVYAPPGTEASRIPSSRLAAFR
jgi:sugar O-acyltransferase (sialic acid O-acetyltransferase NeuD family)